MKKKELRKWCKKGVIIVDATTTYIDFDSEIGSGTTIYPNVTIKGKNIIGKNNKIESNTVIIDSKIGDNNKIIASFLNDATIGNDNIIGPYAHLHNEVVVEDKNCIGNFVEIKKSTIKNNNAINHLSYIGDSILGSKINFSAGAIIANYDWIGKKHNQTIIDDNVMVGANAVLVSPLVLNKECFVAAGSVINKDVPEKALAIARVRQEIKKNYVKEGEKNDSNRDN